MSSSSRPPAPPRPTRPRRPRGSLSRDLILDAAEHVAAQDGFAALTLRAVAARLDAAPMALYRYFATKDDLVNALLDRILGRFVPDPPTDDWLADLRRFTRAHRQVLVDHPWALAGFFTHPSPGRNATRIGEVAFEILRRAFYTRESVVATFGGLLALNYGWTSFAAARDLESDHAVEQVRQAMALLPRDEFPYTAEIAGEMISYGSDRHYDLVLDQYLTGIRIAAGDT